MLTPFAIGRIMTQLPMPPPVVQITEIKKIQSNNASVDRYRCVQVVSRRRQPAPGDARRPPPHTHRTRAHHPPPARRLMVSDGNHQSVAMLSASLNPVRAAHRPRSHAILNHPPPPSPFPPAVGS